MSSRPFRGRGQVFWRGFSRGRGGNRGRGRGRGSKPDKKDAPIEDSSVFRKRSRSRSHSQPRSPEAKKSAVEERKDSAQTVKSPVKPQQKLGPDESIRITIGNDMYREDDIRKDANGSKNRNQEEKLQPKNKKEPSGPGKGNTDKFRPMRGRGRGFVMRGGRGQESRRPPGPRTSMALEHKSRSPRRYRSPGKRRSYSPRRRSRSHSPRSRRSPRRRRSRSRSRGRRYSRSGSRSRSHDRSRSRGRNRSRSRSYDDKRQRSPGRRDSRSRSSSRSRPQSESPMSQKEPAKPNLLKDSATLGNVQKVILNTATTLKRPVLEMRNPVQIFADNRAGLKDIDERQLPSSGAKYTGREAQSKFSLLEKSSPGSMERFDDIMSPRLKDTPERVARLGDVIGLPQTRREGKPLFPVIAPSVMTEPDHSLDSELSRGDGPPRVKKRETWLDEAADEQGSDIAFDIFTRQLRQEKSVSVIPGLGDIKNVEDEEMFLYGDDDDEGTPGDVEPKRNGSPPQSYNRLSEGQRNDDELSSFVEKKSFVIDQQSKKYDESIEAERLRNFQRQLLEAQQNRLASQASEYLARSREKAERRSHDREYSNSPRRDYYDKDSPDRTVRSESKTRQAVERDSRASSEMWHQRFSRERSEESQERTSLTKEQDMKKQSPDVAEEKNVDLGQDPTFRNILKSIGFNFELSELMQKKAQQDREEALKNSLEAKINKTSSFLQAGIREIMGDTSDKKAKKVKVESKESYEERARRYREQQMKAYETGKNSPPPFEGQNAPSETATNPYQMEGYVANASVAADPKIPQYPAADPKIPQYPAANPKIPQYPAAAHPYGMHPVYQGHMMGQESVMGHGSLVGQSVMPGYAYGYDPYGGQQYQQGPDPFCMDFPSVEAQQAGAQRTSNLRVIETLPPEPEVQSNLKPVETSEIHDSSTVLSESFSRNSNRTVLLPKSEQSCGGEKKTIRIIKKDPIKEPESSLALQAREKLRREKQERQKKLEALESELEQLRKLQNELMRKKQRMKDGHKDPMLLENSKLQLEIERQIARLRRAAEDNETKGSGEPPHKKKSSEDTKLESQKSNFPEVKLKEERKLKINYEYYDPGNHWCSHCNVILSNVYDYFSHISSRKHKLKLDPYKRPWMPESLKNVPPKSKKQQNVLEGIKGVEFMMATEAYWCDLCKVFSGDQSCAEHHLKSVEHNQHYQSYLIEHPFYEKSLTLEKAAKLSLQDLDPDEMLESPIKHPPPKKERREEIKKEPEVSSQAEQRENNHKESKESRTIRILDEDVAPRRPKLPFKSPVSPERQTQSSRESPRGEASMSVSLSKYETPAEKSTMEKAGFGKFQIKNAPVRKQECTEIDSSKISIKLSGKMIKTGNPLENYPPRSYSKTATTAPPAMPHFMVKKLKPAQSKVVIKLPPFSKTVMQQPAEKPIVDDEPIMDPKEVADMRLMGIEPDFQNVARAKPPPSMASSQMKPKTSMATTSASALFDIFFANKYEKPQKKEEDAGSDGSDVNLGDFEIIDECSAQKK